MAEKAMHNFEAISDGLGDKEKQTLNIRKKSPDAEEAISAEPRTEKMTPEGFGVVVPLRAPNPERDREKVYSDLLYTEAFLQIREPIEKMEMLVTTWSVRNDARKRAELAIEEAVKEIERQKKSGVKDKNIDKKGYYVAEVDYLFANNDIAELEAQIQAALAEYSIHGMKMVLEKQKKSEEEIAHRAKRTDRAEKLAPHKNKFEKNATYYLFVLGVVEKGLATMEKIPRAKKVKIPTELLRVAAPAQQPEPEVKGLLSRIKDTALAAFGIKKRKDSESKDINPPVVAIRKRTNLVAVPPPFHDTRQNISAAISDEQTETAEDQTNNLAHDTEELIDQSRARGYEVFEDKNPTVAELHPTEDVSKDSRTQVEIEQPFEVAGRLFHPGQEVFYTTVSKIGAAKQERYTVIGMSGDKVPGLILKTAKGRTFAISGKPESMARVVEV